MELKSGRRGVGNVRAEKWELVKLCSGRDEYLFYRD